MEKVKTFLNRVAKDDITGVALWVGVSAAITAVGSFLLQEPRLVNYYGVINIILFTVKSINDRRKK